MSSTSGTHQSLELIETLGSYLAESHRTYDEIARFLGLRILTRYAPYAIYIGILKDDGFIYRLGTFGIENLNVGRWTRIPLSLNLPITESLRENRIIVVNSEEEFRNKYPITEYFSTENLQWKSVVAFPGALSIVVFSMMRKNIKANKELDTFFRAVGAVVSLNHGNGSAPNRKKGNLFEPHESVDRLSTRQAVILKMILRGFTNSRISEEIGFSESLIRQESVRIYKHLNVSGRTELLDSRRDFSSILTDT